MERVRLGDVATFVNGYAFKPSDWSNEGLEIIRIQNLTKSSSEANYYSGTIAEKYKVEYGDVLISWSATLGIFQWKGKTSWLNQHIFKVVFDKKEVDKNYFIFAIQSILDKLKSQVHGATMQHITKSRFDDTKIPLPDLATQKAIAAKLDKADEIRQLNKKLIEQYDTLTQSLFLDMFGDPVKNEKGWEVKLIKELGKVQTGNTPSRQNANYYNSQFIEWIKTDNIVADKNVITQATEYLSREGSLKGRIVKSGSILVACIAGSLDSIGRAAITDRDVAFNQQINSITPNELVNLHFLYYVLRFSKRYFQDNASNGMKRMLSKSVFENLNLAIPPLTLQNEFAERVKAIEAQKTLAQQALQQSEDLFNSLLQESFQ